MMLKGISHIHLIGIGGAGMSGIAQVMLDSGYKVTGSDIKRSRVTERIESLGGEVYIGHREEHLKGADMVIFSSAIPSNNPELEEAKRRGIPTRQRAEVLAELMEGRKTIAVAGTHGKTTTASMISSILIQEGFDPLVIVGGESNDIAANGRLGRGDHFVVEADESDGSLLKLPPSIAVVTNIEADHLDFYRDLDSIIHTFREFVGRIDEDGFLICCGDDPNVRRMLGPIKVVKTLTYGIGEGVDFKAEALRMGDMGSRFEVRYENENLGEVKLNLPGRHNILNSLAAIGVALKVGIRSDGIKMALSKFRGVHRRFEMKGEVGTIRVIDDYAHHPTEVEATLGAAKREGGRRIAIFQPHRYTRTKALGSEFSHSFKDADIVVITEIYSAGEAPIEGIDARLIFDAIREGGHKRVEFIPKKEMITNYLMDVLQPKDVVLTLGAGDIWMVADELLERLKGAT